MRVLFAMVTMLAGLLWVSAAIADSPPPPTPVQRFCTEQWQPVCGTKEGARKTYSNRCFADIDHATDISDGECAAAK
jgi:Kazal-type serine protease inhibitor-like protein